MTLGSLACQTCQLGGFVADGGRDAAPVEPVGTLHDGVEVEVLRVGLGDGAVSAVVDDLRRAHRGSRLGIVESHAVAATGYEARVNAVATHGVDGYLAYLMLGQFCYEDGLMAIVGQGDSNVGLAATGYDAE